MKKEYLGDAVYVDVDTFGRGIVLTTENGIEATNKIYLEPNVLKHLQEYLEALKKETDVEASGGME